MSKLSYQLLDLANPVFASFVVWSSVLILKTLFMSPFTGFYRFKNQVSQFFQFYTEKNARYLGFPTKEQRLLILILTYLDIGIYRQL